MRRPCSWGLTMGKDFRVGLMTGVVLAGAALIWVATRPSLSLRAPVAGARHASPNSQAGQDASPPLPWETAEPLQRDRIDPTDNEVSSVHEVNRVPAGQGWPPPASPNPVPAPVRASDDSPLRAGSIPSPVPPDLTIYETAEPIKTTRFHIVRKGESLSSIAGQYYGSSNQWPKIVAANQKTIKNPNKIAPGTKLIIPD